MRCWPRFPVALWALVALAVGFTALTLITPVGHQHVAASASSAVSRRARATTPAVRLRAIPGQPLRLAVAGDVGTGGTAEYQTAAAMDRFEGAGDYSAVLLLGDNVYPDGNPAELRRTVFDPFAGVLDGSTRLLPVLGNHDNDSGFGDAQVAAFPMPGRWYATQLGDVLVVSLDSNQPNNAAQLRWLERTLASTTAKWKIVEMHHPPYSSGQHGSSLPVRAAFGPLFAKYHVQLVLSGHDHNYQRSSLISGTTFVVSGGAANLTPSGTADFTVRTTSTFHFVDLSVFPTFLELRAIDQAGSTIDFVRIDR